MFCALAGLPASAAAQEAANAQAQGNTSVTGIFDGFMVGGPAKHPKKQNPIEMKSHAKARDSFAVPNYGNNASAPPSSPPRSQQQITPAVESGSPNVQVPDSVVSGATSDTQTAVPVDSQAEHAAGLQNGAGSILQSIQNTRAATQQLPTGNGSASPMYFRNLVKQVKGKLNTEQGGSGTKSIIPDSNRF
jgi:hypothetical protein